MTTATPTTTAFAPDRVLVPREERLHRGKEGAGAQKPSASGWRAARPGTPVATSVAPKFGSTPWIGPSTAPAKPARAAPVMNVSCLTRTVLIPWLRASGSFVITARIVSPSVVKRTISASGGEQAAGEQDQDQPVIRVGRAEDVGGADRRQVEEPLPGAVDLDDELDEHEREPPRREDRVERPRVEPADHDQLDHRPDRAGHERGEQEARPERHAMRAEAHLRVDAHGHQAGVGEVDHVEQPQNQKEARDDDDQRRDRDDRVQRQARASYLL